MFLNVNIFFGLDLFDMITDGSSSPDIVIEDMLLVADCRKKFLVPLGTVFKIPYQVENWEKYKKIFLQKLNIVREKRGEKYAQNLKTRIFKSWWSAIYI